MEEDLAGLIDVQLGYTFQRRRLATLCQLLANHSIGSRRRIETWRDGEMGRWRYGEMGRRRDGETEGRRDGDAPRPALPLDDHHLPFLDRQVQVLSLVSLLHMVREREGEGEGTLRMAEPVPSSRLRVRDLISSRGAMIRVEERGTHSGVFTTLQRPGVS